MDIAANHESTPVIQANERTPEFYLNLVEPEILASFTPEQRQAVQHMLEAAIPRPSSKLVDLRFGIDVILSRFYVVLLVGQDRRHRRRYYVPRGVARIGNAIVAVLLLLAMNLLVSLSILLLLYLTKSALGIDLFPQEHLGDQLQKL